MSNKQGAPFPIWTRCKIHLEQLLAIIDADIRKLRHDPSELFSRMIQPAIWLLIFGGAMANAHAIPTGGQPYLDYIAPGILAQSILFIAIFYGIGLIWERDMGVLHKILVTPAPRSILVIGRAFSAGVRTLPQVAVIYVICLFMGVNIRWDLFALIGVAAMAMVGAAIFSTFSLIVASIVKKRERFMGLGNIMTMPLFFASNALYPIETLPAWIKVLSIINPLTYQVDALRSLMIMGEISHFGLLFDFSIGIATFGVLAAIATVLYPKILY